MTKVKLSAKVIAAEELKAEKQKELALAEAAIKTLKDELSAAYIAVRKA